MNTETMWKPALGGGVLLGVLSALPVIGALNCFCCAWAILGGGFAAYLYVKHSPAAVTLGRGALLGALTGAVGTAVYALFSIPLHFLPGDATARIAERMRETLAGMPDAPPETLEMLEALTSSGNFPALLLVSGLAVSLVLYCLFAMLGGAVGVALLEKRPVGAAVPPRPPAPPPAGE